MKSHCKRGHALTPDNVKLEKNGTYLQQRCLQCRRAYDSERYHDKPARREAVLACSAARYERIVA